MVSRGNQAVFFFFWSLSRWEKLRGERLVGNGKMGKGKLEIFLPLFPFSGFLEKKRAA